jgi:outer membrane receptor protein involved in Fe transport
MKIISLSYAVRLALLGLTAAGVGGAGVAAAQQPSSETATGSPAAEVGAPVVLADATTVGEGDGVESDAGADAGDASDSEQVRSERDESTAGEGEIGEVVVTARQKTAAEQVADERIAQEVPVDIVGAAQISRVGDSTVSLALRRLPGVTLVGDQFIYIRGLGERYSSTTLNGASVPSPDLTRNVIPLDLFPAEIVESLTVQKGYSPDKPAAFGGGNVDIRTRTIPEELTAYVQVGTGWNADSSGSGLSYRGGGADRWGRDDGTRALPGQVSQAIQDYRGGLGVQDIYQSLIRQGGIRTVAEAEAINRGLITSLNRTLEPTERSLDPDLSMEAGLGTSFDVTEGSLWKAGFLVLGDYGNQWRNRERINRSVTDPEGDADFTARTTHQVNLTGSAALGLDFAEEQTFGANFIYLRNTEDEASITTGTNQNFRRENGDQLRNYRVRYEERDLRVYQLQGRHELGEETLAALDHLGPSAFVQSLQGLTFDWYWSRSEAGTDLPSEVTYSAQDQVDPQTGSVLRTFVRPSATSAEYRFSELLDDVRSRGFSVAMPLTFGPAQLLVSGGGDYYQKARSYLQNQLNFGSTVASASGVLQGTPESVFTDANVLDPRNGFALSIGGIGTESYLAGETIGAGWGKFDLKWGESWRISGGARHEDFLRVVAPVNPLQFDVNRSKIVLPPGSGVESLARQQDDWYPALAVTYIRPGFWADDFQLRFGFSQTTARPDLREVSGATYIDPLTEARVRGNPDLVNADLTNLDIRAEWFFAGGDNFTVSLFHKDIQAPIETVEGAGSDDNVSLGFVNAESAELYGIEFEWLKSLGFVSGNTWSDPFFVSGNLTVSDSTLTIGEAAGLNLTNNERRMSQHSPIIANVQLGYDSPGGKHSASLVYAYFGERVFFAGRGGADDAVEQPFHSVDVVWSWYPIEPLTLKLRAQNLLDSDTVIEQGGVDVLEQTIGRTFKFDVTYRF